MANWRFGAFPKLPYSTMQQLNLDWILDRIRRFLPDNGTKGQVLTRTKDGAAWQDVSAVAGGVNSVNGKTGAVVLTASDVGALPSSYQAPVTSVNGMTGDVVIQAGGGAVDSVNGQTGEVVLDAEDVGAMPDTYVAPVQSVNGQTGNVTLDASDVGALPDTYTAPVTSVNGQTGAVSLTIPKFYTLFYTFDNLAQYTDSAYYLSLPSAFDTAGIPENAVVFGMLPEGWSGLGQQFSLARNGARGMYILHQPNFNITSSSYVKVWFYYYIL